MSRSLTVTWEDPLAAFEEGKKLAKPIGVVHGGKTTATAEARLEDAGGKLYAHGTTTCIIISP